MRALLAAAALGAALSLGLAAGTLAFRAERARSLLRPVEPAGEADPPGPPPAGPEPLEACAAEEVMRAGSAVTAILAASDGALWIGTEAGVLRRAPGGPAADAIAGGEAAVAGLAEHDGLVWAATDRGALAFDGERRVAEALGGEAVATLVRAGGRLLAATPRGLFRLTVDHGAEDLQVAGPAGEPVRPTALAAGEGRLWVGTASGAWVVPLSTLAAPLLVRTALALRAPTSSRGAIAVTALAPVPGGAVAGTDDEGLVFLAADGTQRAAQLADARARSVNSGAAASLGGVAVLGSRGGLLLARAGPAGLAVGRPAGLEAASITAVLAGGGELLVGTAEGAVLRLVCPGLGPAATAGAIRTSGGVGLPAAAPARGGSRPSA